MTTSSTGGSSTAQTAKEEAGQVASTAAGAGQHVADTARDEASRVASEAKSQARELYQQTREELTDQAAAQQKRVASGLRSMSQELDGMAANSEQSGMATELVGQAAARLDDVAGWLDQRDPGSLLDEVKRFAARRPGVFIGVAAAAGLLAGRLTRGIAGALSDEKEAEQSGTTGFSTTTPATTPVASPTTPVAPLPPEPRTTSTYGSGVPSYGTDTDSSTGYGTGGGAQGAGTAFPESETR